MLPLREQLLIIPTTLEQSCIGSQLESLGQAGLSSANCGVGLIESAVSGARLISVYQPKRVWLIGIAGSFSDHLEIGQAYEFGAVSCYGVGVGNGASFQLPSDLGWQKLVKFADADRLQLDCGFDEGPELLSVTAASASRDEAEVKGAKFPMAGAEDMEAYSIALHCRAFGIKCRVIRGISNRAGDRRHAHWKVQEAMTAAIELCATRIKEEQ
ncbi:MAG: hypothetical protein U0930_11880 [Pirellulales bacterium]